MFYHIVAMGCNRVIGQNGQLIVPYFPAELKAIQKLTWGKSVIMGHRTHEILGKDLEGRRNYVVTRIGMSLAEALERTQDEEAVYIIGGQSVFEQTINIVDGIYAFTIHHTFPGDRHYPFIPDCFVPVKSIKEFPSAQFSPRSIGHHYVVEYQFFKRVWKYDDKEAYGDAS